MNFGLARDEVVLLKTAANLCTNWRQANDFFAVFCLYLYNKTLNDCPAGNSEFYFPSTSMFPEAKHSKIKSINNNKKKRDGRQSKTCMREHCEDQASRIEDRRKREKKYLTATA